jgi:hypothetical protein
MHLLLRAVRGTPCKVIIATHSTAVVASMKAEARVCFMRKGDTRLQFEEVSKAMEDVLPIFGAHPLSNVFNSSPILLVEGEDDERIWQQAVRTSRGSIKLWPCVAGDVQSLNRHEVAANKLIGAVYDHAIGYSLRDRDDDPYDIADEGQVIRFRLNCRTAENLILSNDVLIGLGITWEEMQAGLSDWIERKPRHPQTNEIRQFEQSGWNRLSANVKSLRNILLAVALGSRCRAGHRRATRWQRRWRSQSLSFSRPQIGRHHWACTKS